MGATHTNHQHTQSINQALASFCFGNLFLLGLCPIRALPATCPTIQNWFALSTKWLWLYVMSCLVWFLTHLLLEASFCNAYLSWCIAVCTGSLLERASDRYKDNLDVQLTNFVIYWCVEHTFSNDTGQNWIAWANKDIFFILKFLLLIWCACGLLTKASDQEEGVYKISPYWVWTFISARTGCFRCISTFNLIFVSFHWSIFQTCPQTLPTKRGYVTLIFFTGKIEWAQEKSHFSHFYMFHLNRWVLNF